MEKFVKLIVSAGVRIQITPTTDYAPSLANADVVVLTLPADGKGRTVNLVDHDFLRAMKRGAVLVNMSRAEIVDEEAVAGAICDGHVCYATDVHSPAVEATGDYGGTILGNLHYAGTHFPNLLATPHMGGTTQQALANMTRSAIKATLEALKLDSTAF